MACTGAARPRGSRLGLLLPALLVLTLPACVAYRSGGARRPEPAEEAEAPKKSISVLIRARGSYRGANRELPDYIVAKWKSAVLRAYRESGLFSEVREGIGRETDLQASVRIENTLLAPRGISFLAAASFLAVPTRNRDYFEMQTTLTDPSGAVLASLQSTGTVTTFYQILLLPAAVFLSRDAVVGRSLYDLTLDTAAQAQRKGLL